MTSDHSSILQKMVSVFFVILGNVLYALTVKLFLLPADLVTGGTTVSVLQLITIPDYRFPDLY